MILNFFLAQTVDGVTFCLKTALIFDDFMILEVQKIDLNVFSFLKIFQANLD